MNQESHELEDLLKIIETIIANTPGMDHFGNSLEFQGENPFSMFLDKDIDGLKQWIEVHQPNQQMLTF